MRKAVCMHKWVHFFPCKQSLSGLSNVRWSQKTNITSLHNLLFQRDLTMLLSKNQCLPTSIYPRRNSATSSLLILLVCFPTPRPCCTIPKKMFPGITQCIHRYFVPINHLLWHRIFSTYISNIMSMWHNRHNVLFRFKLWTNTTS